MGDERRRKVLFVGRLDRQKGSDILLEAVAGLQNEVVLYLVGAHVVGRGKPPEIASPHVQVLGWRSAEEINAYLADCDVLVIPSRWEGFGLVALEAMRLAKPIIASAVGGLKEIVVDGITGIHVPVADVDALRSAISRPTAQELVEMGLRGRERFERHYRIERVHGELRQLYAHVAGVKAAVSSSERSYTAIGAPVEDEK
jgi:glycosyltransferase involved in cell wall biosynthesis